MSRMLLASVCLGSHACNIVLTEDAIQLFVDVLQGISL